jgi:hypothetical protein
MNKPRLSVLSCLIGSVFAVSATTQAAPEAARSQVGQSFEVPYLLTQTNHFVVRALINGKGPFHLVVDTGAPGLFLATEAAKKAGVKSDPKKFYSNLGDLKLEGGPTLENLKIRVEDPFQLGGMNALGLPGVKLDGLMGFSVLARYRITLDPTHRRMTWTRLDFAPKESIDDLPALRKQDMPLQLQAMEMLGPAMKIASLFVGKQPPTLRLSQGFAGFSIRTNEGAKAQGVRVSGIIPDSPAASAGLMEGDVILKCDGEPVREIEELTGIFAKKAAGAKLRLEVKRADETKSFEIVLQEWF